MIQHNSEDELKVRDSDTYQQLLRDFPPRPITNDEDLSVVRERILSLVDQDNLTNEHYEYISVLDLLVLDYEQRRYPVQDMYGVNLIKALISERDMKQKDLVPVFKTESIVSAVLSGQRKLTAEHIYKLAEMFHISTDVFYPSRRQGEYDPAILDSSLLMDRK